MIFNILFFMQSAHAEKSDPGSGSIIGSLLFPVVLIAVFYFFLIRPQQKKNKEQQSMLEKIKVDDEIVTVSGIYGVVKSIDGPVVKLLIAKDVTIQLQKHTIISPLPKGTFKPNSS